MIAMIITNPPLKRSGQKRYSEQRCLPSGSFGVAHSAEPTTNAECVEERVDFFPHEQGQVVRWTTVDYPINSETSNTTL